MRVLKRIYEELVAIRKELQALSSHEEFKDGVSISTYLPNHPQAYTKVSFFLPYRDWCQLEKTVQWEEFQDVLQECQSKHSQQFRLGQEGKLGKR